MTGNSGSGHKLLAILGRYKPAPWRGGYSLFRLFFNFYLLAMGSFVAIAFFADFVISNAVRGITDDYTSRFMRGTIVLIEDELFRKPRHEWQKTIRRLDDKFAYKLDIVDRWTLKLPPKQAEKLDAGEMAVDAQGDIIYHRLKQTPQILVVGPLSPERNPEYQRGMPLDLRISLLTWSLIGLCLAIAVWLWIRPVWRDLEAMRKTARALGEGHFEARAPQVRSRAFELLAETLNGMAERIQRLIATQKELSSAISHELRTPIARMRFALEMIAETESLGPVDFAEWLEDEIDSIRILGRTLTLTVDTSALPPGLRVQIDRKSLPYAIKNLLRNAIRYARTTIHVSAAIAGDRIQIHVDDDGIGIPPEERERVFSAFTRLDRSRDRSTGGYGLGLAIARLVMEMHGGTASADESPLGGARFTLAWPLLQNVTKT
ncbi:MAG: ATP-binding protein [Proteobacteria bacterium]|nr:ATP-binding protein [Pseudomonadota bacterium]